MKNKNENWSVLLAYEPWKAQKLVHLVGACTLAIAKERARDVAQNAEHYLIIRTP